MPDGARMESRVAEWTIENDTGDFRMASRRSFIKQVSSAGLAFCGCGLIGPHAHAQDTIKPRGPIHVGGKRIRTVDAHAHCYFQDSLDLLPPDKAKASLPQVKGVAQHFLGKTDVLSGRLHEMDEQSIDTQILSINPFWYREDVALSKQICELNNRHLSEVCHAHPDRFGAFASLTMQDPETAAAELEHAVKQLGLKGAAIGSNVLGVDFSDPKFEPVLAKAEELEAVLFIHPISDASLAKRYKGNGWMSNVIGNPLDTTIALEHLVYQGTMDKHPKLKVLGAHGGGYFGSYGPRMDHSCYVSPQNCDASITLAKKPTEYMKEFYYDSLIFTPEMLRHLVAEVGASQVVIGSDHPIPWEEHPVEVVMNTKTLTPTERIAILGTNAEKLFKLQPMSFKA
jgi:aminocarboxymuconate-semialdehyde decarboxylase